MADCVQNVGSADPPLRRLKMCQRFRCADENIWGWFRYTQRVQREFHWRQRLVLRVIPPVAAMVIRLLGMTLRYEDVVEEGGTIGFDVPPPAVYAFWHRSLLSCAWRFRKRKIVILISRSFDGELIARTVERLGYVAVRGSSSRDGFTGLLNLQRAYEEGHYCGITADGPRGPRYVAKRGTAQLAALVGAQVGSFYALPDRAWELGSWDRLLVPKPFSKIYVSWPRLAAAEHEAVQAALDRSVVMAEAALRGKRASEPVTMPAGGCEAGKQP